MIVGDTNAMNMFRALEVKGNQTLFCLVLEYNVLFVCRLGAIGREERACRQDR
jgi:hypothetical protein